MKSAKERMDIISAYQQVGSYRAAAELCGTTPKTVKRVVKKFESGEGAPPRAERAHNFDAVTELVAERVEKSQGRMSAKRILPIARAAGYEGPVWLVPHPAFPVPDLEPAQIEGAPLLATFGNVNGAPH